MLRWLRSATSKKASVDRLVSEGSAAGTAGDNAGAIAAFEAALRLDPDHVGALRMLGFLETRAGHEQAGLAKLDRACLLQPQLAVIGQESH